MESNNEVNASTLKPSTSENTSIQQLTNEQKKTLAVAARKADNLKRIKEANEKLLSFDCAAAESILTSPPSIKPFIPNTTSLPTSNFRIGAYVEVAEDFSTGHNRPGGCGYITAVHGMNTQLFFDVKYTVAHDNGRSHKNIPLSQLTSATLHQDMMGTARSRPSRTCTHKSLDDDGGEVILVPRDLRTKTEILLELLANGTRKKKGWHRKDLMLNHKLLENKQTRVPQLNDAEKTQLLAETEMLRTHQRYNGGSSHSDRNKRKGTFKKRTNRYRTDSLTYLVEHGWGLSSGRKYIQRLENKTYRNALKNGVDTHSASVLVVVNPTDHQLNNDDVDVRTVIDSYELAAQRFTVKNLFIKNKTRQQAADLESIDRATYNARVKEAERLFQNLSAEDIEFWEQIRREHLRLWPTIKDTILCEMRENNQISYEKLEAKINYWCSDKTIRRWVQSRDGYRIYMERVIPLLTVIQKSKHLACAKGIRSNWGLGGGKFLWVHYDEKWFWGLVLRANAKSFDELDPAILRTYHKSHISKVMGIGAFGFAFVDNVENGGDALKIDFTRCQSYKVAERMQRESRRDDNGKLHYDGAILRKKDDLYLVDCAVTGSSVGTADNPKFSLLVYFRKKIFETIKHLIREGGPYHGYLPVIQGDQAGPHTDSVFLKGVKDYCNEQGWHWIPQAPQMPHMNVCDLSVFPNMSKRHSQLARDHHGKHVLTEDQIWEAAKKVEKDLPSEKIARGFVQAYRLAARVIDHGGDNGFLTGSSGGIHVGISRDFIATDKGIKRRDGNVFPPPTPIV